MDHRISKDMISNGMTPSGQKSQQDLSRSQYGSAATPASLAEAYRQIHESMVTKKPMPQMPPKTSPRPSVNPQDKVKRDPSDYGMKKEEYGTKDSSAPPSVKGEKPMGQHPGKSPDKATRDKYETQRRRNEAPTGVGVPDKSVGYGQLQQSVDLFDIVKGHLIDEHNLSEDVALQLMSILDEETRADIMEYTAAIRADAAPKGTTMKMTATGKEPAGDRLLRGIKDRVGGFLRNLNPNALKSTTVEPRKPLVAIPRN